MDPDAVSGHLPPLLCQDDHANLYSVNGHFVSLEQNRFWAGSGRILLGLLLHPDPGRTCQWQVSDSAGENGAEWQRWAANLHGILGVAVQALTLWCLLFIRVGGERVLFISACSWALITAATPLLAHLGSHTLALITLSRFLMGLLQGEHYANLFMIVDSWWSGLSCSGFWLLTTCPLFGNCTKTDRSVLSSSFCLIIWLMFVSEFADLLSETLPWSDAHPWWLQNPCLRPWWPLGPRVFKHFRVIQLVISKL